jgi:hypothetical protein
MNEEQLYLQMLKSAKTGIVYFVGAQVSPGNLSVSHQT